MGITKVVKRKTAGKVEAIIYLPTEDDDGKWEVEVSGYFTPEQQGSETDPYLSANIEFEHAQDSLGIPVKLSTEHIALALEALWAEVH